MHSLCFVNVKETLYVTHVNYNHFDNSKRERTGNKKQAVELFNSVVFNDFFSPLPTKKKGEADNLVSYFSLFLK